jgi:hypothetical protein
MPPLEHINWDEDMNSDAIQVPKNFKSYFATPSARLTKPSCQFGRVSVGQHRGRKKFSTGNCQMQHSYSSSLKTLREWIPHSRFVYQSVFSLVAGRFRNFLSSSGRVCLERNGTGESSEAANAQST